MIPGRPVYYVIERNAVLLPARKGTVMDPKKLRFSKTHEWASLEGTTCTIGISQFAVEQLTDVIYIDLPDLDDPVATGDSFGEIESVKAVSDLYSPITGDVIAVNDKLQTDPAVISKDPYEKGWLIKVKVEKGTTLEHLLTFDQYQKQIASEEH